MSVAISRMTADQASATSDLIQRTIVQLTYYNERARTEEVAKYTCDALSSSISDDPDSVLVATLDGTVVGFCISRYDDALLWLSWFGVDAGHRRRGIGFLLLQELGKSLGRRRAHKVWCDTRTSNETSAKVLKETGFVQLAELKNHWYGQDFYLWEWTPS